MKKIFFLCLLLIGSMAGYSQNSQAVTMTALNGAVTVNSDSMTNARTITALCTQTGGTSDGSLVYQVSTDGVVYTTVSSTAGVFEFYPDDTLTITAGATWSIIDNSPFRFSRIRGAGTSGDSTAVTIKYRKK